MDKKYLQGYVSLTDYEHSEMDDEHLERVKAAYLYNDVDYLYQALIDDEYFTEDELDLVTDVAGYSISTLNDCIYSRYGYNDFEQLYNFDLNAEENEELEEDSDEDENLSYKGRIAKYSSEVNEEDEE